MLATVAPSSAARLLKAAVDCACRLLWLFTLSTFAIAISTTTSTAATLQTAETPQTEFIICRKCGNDIADSHYLYNKLSPNSKVLKNLTLFGKSKIDIQLLTNPMGVQFKIINTSKALCTGIGEWVSTQSWFPGFLWKYCVCPNCSAHLGWIFEPESTATSDRNKPSDKGFYALIYDNVLGEKYLQSLMVFPTIFRS